jgi:Fe2+ transport system protein B
MSLKQLRKFKNQTSAAKVISLINEVELSEEEEEVIVNKRVNLFDMLDTGDPEIAQSQSESEEQTPIVHIVAIKSKSKKKKKKKAKLLKQKLEKSESDFEAEPQPIVQEEEVEEVLDSNDDPLFRLDYRNFDREFELQKSFGKSVVSGKKVKTKTMIQVSKSWPRSHSGLTLVAIEGTNGFKLEYSKR